MTVMTKVSKKFQIVIPKKVRDSIGISEGDEVSIDVDNDRIVIKVKPKSYTKKLKGLHKDLWKVVDPLDYVKNERDGWR